MFEWLDLHKNEDTVLINFLKIMYILGKKKVLHSILVTLLGLLIPVLIDFNQYIWAIALVVGLVLLIIFHSMCSTYHDRKYEQRKLSSKILENQSSLINTLNIEIRSNPKWKESIFKKISEIVCEKIQIVFNDILHCKTRVSIEYVFEKNIKDKTEKYVKISGRRSPNRDSCKKSTLLKNRHKYFSHRIFTKNIEGINTRSEAEIKNGMYWYNNPTHRNGVKQYIGIAVSVRDDNNVDYILQIDCMNDITFGKNNTKEEIELFINRYLKSYINIVSLSYLLNLNRNKQIPEV